MESRLPQYFQYGNSSRILTHDALLNEAKNQGNLFARAENSGSEGCYVEVAKWDEKNNRWAKYAFAKILPGDFRKDAVKAATFYANHINEAAQNKHIAFIHTLPTFSK